MLLQLKIDDLLLLLTDQELLTGRIDHQVTQQRLREVEVEIRREPRIERVGWIARRVAGAVQRGLVASAPPFQLLRDARARSKPAIGDEIIPGEKILRRIAVAVLCRPPEDDGREGRARLCDGESLRLRTQPLGTDSQVVFECQLHRFVGAQLKLRPRDGGRLRSWRGRCNHLSGWGRGRGRLSGCEHNPPGTEQ